MLLVSILLIAIVTLLATVFYMVKKYNQSMQSSQASRKRSPRITPVINKVLKGYTSTTNSSDLVEVSEEDSDKILGLDPKHASTLRASPADEAVDVKPAVKQRNNDDPRPVIVLYLLAPEDKPYSGYELLQALLSTGFRYGDKKIFHYMRSDCNNGKALFSLASMQAPGIFDLPQMGGFVTKGLALFLESEFVNDSKTAFAIMMQVIEELLDGIGGTVLDADRQPLTQETWIKYQQQLEHQTQSQYTMDLFTDAEVS